VRLSVLALALEVQSVGRAKSIPMVEVLCFLKGRLP